MRPSLENQDRQGHSGAMILHALTNEMTHHIRDQRFTDIPQAPLNKENVSYYRTFGSAAGKKTLGGTWKGLSWFGARAYRSLDNRIKFYYNEAKEEGAKSPRAVAYGKFTGDLLVAFSSVGLCAVALELAKDISN